MSEIIKSQAVKILEFLHARLDEEEAFINAVEVLTSLSESSSFFSSPLPEMHEYVVRFQPNRLLREIKLKRSILSQFQVREISNFRGTLKRQIVDRSGKHGLLVEMAEVYCNHEDYPLLWIRTDTPKPAGKSGGKI